MLELIFGPANSGKSTQIYERIAGVLQRHAGGVVLMVPEQSSFESERALLRRLGSGFSGNVEVLTFSRLAELVAREAGGIAGIPIGDSGRLIAMGRALELLKPALTYYGRQTKSPDFIRSALHIIQEFKQSGLSSAELNRLSDELEEGSLKYKMRDFSMILSQYDDLVSRSHIDTDDSLNVLYDTLAEQDFFADKQVFFDSFFGFTGQQYKIIDRIFKWTDKVCIALPGDGQTSSRQEYGVFSNIQKTADRVRRIAGAHGVKAAAPVVLDAAYFESTALTALECGFRGGEGRFDAPTDDVTITACDSMYEELDTAAATIHRLVRENPGIRFRDFVVIARDMDRCKNAAELIFARYHIPVFMDERRPASTFPLMICVMSAFHAAMTFSSAELFKWLKTGLSDLTYEEIAALENYADIWNLGGEDWLKPFDRNPQGFSDLKEAADYTDELAALNASRERAVTPLLRLKGAIASGSALKMADGLYRFVTACPADRLREAADRAERAGEQETADLYRGSYELLMSILSGLASGFSDAAVSGEIFYQMLCLVISAETLGAIPQKLDTVVAGSAEKIRPGRPRFTFLIGFNQGAFPRISAGGLLNTRERTLLTERGLLIKDCGLGSSVEESYLLYRTLFSCYSRLFISYSRTSPSGERMMPSSYVKQITDILPNCAVIEQGGGALTPDELETADAALGKLAVHFREDSPTAAALRSYFETAKDYAEKLAVLSRGLSAGPERLSEDTARRLFGENIVLSASRLDTFARCRFSYFCKYGLKAKPLRRAELDVMQRGTAVHYVLERLTTQYKGALKDTTDAQREQDIEAFLNEYAAIMLDGQPLADARLIFLMRRLKVLLCEIAARLAEEFSLSSFSPAYCELSIGFDKDSAVEPPSIPLNYGKAQVVGSVDRVDTMDCGGSLIFRVVDYKTGTKKFALPDVLYGLNMQMLLYLFAIRRGGIRGVDKPLIPAGILYLPAKRAIASGEEGDRDAESAVRMNGLLVGNTEWLTAMNRNRDGRFVPVRFTKNGEPYKSASLIGAAELDLIEEHIDSCIREMGDRLHAGDIAVSPVDGVASDACEYCDYAAVCLRREEAPRTQAEKLPNDAVIARIRKEGEANGLCADETTG